MTEGLPGPGRAIQTARAAILPYERLLRWIPDSARLFDVGCGSGTLIGLAFSQGLLSHATGVDRAPAIEKARAILSDRPVDLLVGEDFNLWPEGPFGCVTCIDVLHHVPPSVQIPFIGAMAQRVAPGGRLIYKDMADRPWPYAMFNRFHDFVMAGERINYLPLDRARDAIVGSGLIVEHEEEFKRGLYWHQLVVGRCPPA